MLFKRPVALFSEEANAHLEQLNEPMHHNNLGLVAFTPTTD
jgi:hypothetical protein